MNLREAVDAYIAWRRAHGARFVTGARILHQFCRHAGDGIGCSGVGAEVVLGFLAGKGPLTPARSKKFSALAGFYRYAISRGHAGHSPLPATEDEPRRPQPAPPHVYSREELRHLFSAVESSRHGAVQLDAETMKTLLLLLYGAGLPVLRGPAADLRRCRLGRCVADDSGYEVRQVPACACRPAACRSPAQTCPVAQRPAIAERNRLDLSCQKDGAPLAQRTVCRAFHKTLEAAGIRQDRDGGRRSPSLHGLRHAAAVHRLEDWYRNDADVQRLLPALSTWLGHANLDGTSVYLTMTPELLHQTSARFERHFLEGQRQ